MQVITHENVLGSILTVCQLEDCRCYSDGDQEPIISVLSLKVYRKRPHLSLSSICNKLMLQDTPHLVSKGTCNSLYFQ